MYRSPTGQTGPDAYIYEATAIKNALRDLNARAKRLAEIMVAELPEDYRGKMSIASERFPDATTDIDRVGITRMLEFDGTAANAQWLIDYAQSIRNPEHVIRHDVS